MNKLNFPVAVVDVSEIKRDGIVLDRYLRLGDVVAVQMDPESRAYGQGKETVDGLVGIVIAFKRYTNFRARIGDFGMKPGEYLCNGGAVIAWSNGTNSGVSAHDIRWYENHEAKKIERQQDKAWNEAYEFDAWIKELPELPFWEHDIVELVSKHRSHWNSPIVRVQRIDYHRIGDKRNDGSPMPIYDCTPVEPGHGSSSFEETELVLVERGKLWKWFHDERDQIVWKDIAEEISFHSSLGLTEQIHCEQSGSYSWPLSAILPALKAGTIDTVTRSHGFFGGASSGNAIKINDADLAERARAETTKGFSKSARMCVTSSEWNDKVRQRVLKIAIQYGGIPFLVSMDTRGLMDTKGFKELNLPILAVNTATMKIANPDNPGVEENLPDSYVFFSKTDDPFDLPKDNTFEISEENERFAAIFGGGPFGGGRPSKELLQLRVQSNTGWSEKNRDVVIAACKEFDLCFIDRAGIADDVMKESGIKTFCLPAGDKLPFEIKFELEGYVFFTHRGMNDLPFDSTINGVNEKED